MIKEAFEDREMRHLFTNDIYSVPALLVKGKLLEVLILLNVLLLQVQLGNGVGLLYEIAVL